MEQVDILVVGAATAGSYFARKIAEAGHSVLVIEKLTKESLGRRLDIFHVAKADFARFELPLPEKNDDLAFEFSGGRTFSAFDRYPKNTPATVVGMHMYRYIARLNNWAREAGAVFVYGAAFLDFLYENGRIIGAVYEQNGERHEVYAKLVADCSGIPSVARRNLPVGYGVENFAISNTEQFYVTLRYVVYHDPMDYVKSTRGWTYYKTWEAPEGSADSAILGVGANYSYDEGEKVFAAFERAVKLPRYTVKRIERGTTPYRRPPYSFVADGFLVSGDAACLTKPSAGEGVTASMVQLEIAAEVVNRLLDEGGYVTRARLWPINTRYVAAQGKAFAGQLATLIGAMSSTAEENDFFFQHDVIFSDKTFAALGNGEPLAFPAGELLRMAAVMAGGVFTGKLRVSTIRSLLRGMQNGSRAEALYASYPTNESGYDAWIIRAEAFWKSCGSMAENTVK
ncbi:MAG: NAD(P)/FAD-dependent oxidoreductase [Eubacteriales bacterium]|nr:NAD(P)/FAD-dependent oxidoreductase [Eubacteriales bacterium]